MKHVICACETKRVNNLFIENKIKVSEFPLEIALAESENVELKAFY